MRKGRAGGFGLVGWAGSVCCVPPVVGRIGLGTPTNSSVVPCNGASLPSDGLLGRLGTKMSLMLGAFIMRERETD